MIVFTSRGEKAAYEKALEKKGLPSVYAQMASPNLTHLFTKEALRTSSLPALLSGGFVWGDSQDGHEFWGAVYEECRALKPPSFV